MEIYLKKNLFEKIQWLWDIYLLELLQYTVATACALWWENTNKKKYPVFKFLSVISKNDLFNSDKLVWKDMDVNDHDRLSNFTLRHKLK